MRRCEKESCCGIDILKKIKPLLKYNDQEINALPIKRDNDLDLKIMFGHLWTTSKCKLSSDRWLGLGKDKIAAYKWKYCFIIMLFNKIMMHCGCDALGFDW